MFDHRPQRGSFRDGGNARRQRDNEADIGPVPEVPDALEERPCYRRDVLPFGKFLKMMAMCLAGWILTIAMLMAVFR